MGCGETFVQFAHIHLEAVALGVVLPAPALKVLPLRFGPHPGRVIRMAILAGLALDKPVYLSLCSGRSSG